MRAHLYRWLLPLGLATSSLLASVPEASAQPTVRDHRDRRPGPRGPRERVDAGPREAPPALREETVKTRLHRARRMLRQSLEGRLASTLRDAFPFAGARCARITEAVLARMDGNRKVD